MSQDQNPEIESLVGPGYRIYDNQLPPELPGTLEVPREKLAAGSFADVHHGKWVRPGKPPMTVAIKRVTIPGKNIPDAQFRTVSAITKTLASRSLSPHRIIPLTSPFGRTED